MSGNDYMISRKLNPKSTVKTVKKPIISFHRSPIQVFWKQWHQILMLLKFVSSQVVLVVKNTCQCRRHKRHGFNFWVRSGRSPGKGNGNPLQYSCLKNSMSREAWRTTVHGIVSQTQLKQLACTWGSKEKNHLRICTEKTPRWPLSPVCERDSVFSASSGMDPEMP